jgi:hypothetical protein
VRRRDRLAGRAHAGAARERHAVGSSTVSTSRRAPANPTRAVPSTACAAARSTAQLGACPAAAPATAALHHHAQRASPRPRDSGTPGCRWRFRMRERLVAALAAHHAPRAPACCSPRVSSTIACATAAASIMIGDTNSTTRPSTSGSLHHDCAAPRGSAPRRPRRSGRSGSGSTPRAEDPGPAGVGDDRDPIPARRGLIRERGGHREQLAHRLGAEDAALLEQRFHGDVASDQ